MIMACKKQITAALLIVSHTVSASYADQYNIGSGGAGDANVGPLLLEVGTLLIYLIAAWILMSVVISHIKSHLAFGDGVWLVVRGAVLVMILFVLIES